MKIHTDLEIEINEYIRKENISLHAAAMRFGVSPTYLYRIEKRETELVPIRIQAMIAEKLELDFELELASEPGSFEPPRVQLFPYRYAPDTETTDDAE